jgi:hypothetical protein
MVQHPDVSVPAECNDGVAPPPSAAHPEAKPGYLCAFRGFFETEIDTRLEVTVKPFPGGGTGSGTTGAVLVIDSESAPQNSGYGTWAVTGALGS